MIKRIGVLFLMAGSLLAYEDVSFSARTLGLGGDHAAVADDAFAAFVNPAAPARWARPLIGFSLTPYPYGDCVAFSYIQPVRRLGTVGGSFLIHPVRDIHELSSLSDAQARLNLSIPFGKYFKTGFALGVHSQGWSMEPYYSPYYKRFGEGFFVSLGAQAMHPRGINLALAIDGLNQHIGSVSNVGVSWQAGLKNTTVLSSLLLAGNVGLRFTDEILKIHVGAEGWFFSNILGIRAGIRYGTDELSGFSPTFGASLRTHRVERTDFELHYGTALNYGTADTTLMLHMLSVNILFGDARKAEKDSIKIAQAERARKLREQALARERDKLRAELDAIKQERSALEAEREDIERLRHEALAALGRLRGVEFAENDTFIRITVTEAALKFGEDAAEIPFPQGYYTLDKVAGFLFGYPNNGIVVECHTNVGPSPESSEESEEALETGEPPQYKNAKALTTARAKIIRRYFVEVKGIPSSNITARGAGDSKPLVEDDAANPANRRVEITINKTP